MGHKVIFKTDQTSEQIAYTAGIVDGEGCFYIGKVKQGSYGNGWQWRAMLEVTSCDKILIDWLNTLFIGATEEQYRWTSKKKFYRPVYKWRAHGPLLDHLLPLLKPYLTIKSKHCDVMIKFRSTCKNIGSKRLPDSVNSERDIYHKEMRKLNSRYHDHPLKK